MNEVAFLAWVRGIGFQIALGIFIVGMVVRWLEIFLLGKKHDYSDPKGSAVQGAIHTIFSRSIPEKSTWQRSRVQIVTGYVFHIGLLLIILFLTPHITIFREFLGFGWAGLPSSVVDIIAVITMFALLVVLVRRIQDPVLRFISTFQDYLVWTVTFLPLLTGYMAYHHLGFSYPTILGLHILSVEILLVLFPFTKLMHAITLFIARGFNGATAGHKGVQA
jgi:nitrate reductase gamma subunit